MIRASNGSSTTLVRSVGYHQDDLHFYLVGQSILLMKHSVNCSNLDVDISFYSSLLDKKCSQTLDANEEFTEIINNRLKEYTGTRKNVHYVDRNDVLFAYMSDTQMFTTYYNIRINGETVFIDDKRYTNLGS